MKRKLNIILTLSLLALVGTAYATCYLNQVVLCFKAGDTVVGSYLYTGGSGPNTSFTTQVYADEDCWRYDLYSVTRGGRTLASAKSYLSYCVGINGAVGAVGPNTHENDQTGFEVYFYNPNVGSTVTGWNAPGGGPTSDGRDFYHVTAYYVDQDSVQCN